MDVYYSLIEAHIKRVRILQKLGLRQHRDARTEVSESLHISYLIYASIRDFIHKETPKVLNFWGYFNIDLI